MTLFRGLPSVAVLPCILLRAHILAYSRATCACLGAVLDSIDRFLLHDRLDSLQTARKQRDPIRIARAKDAVRELLERCELSPRLFEQAVLALIDPCTAHAYGSLDLRPDVRVEDVERSEAFDEDPPHDSTVS